MLTLFTIEQQSLRERTSLLGYHTEKSWKDQLCHASRTAAATTSHAVVIYTSLCAYNFCIQRWTAKLRRRGLVVTSTSSNEGNTGAHFPGTHIPRGTEDASCMPQAQEQGPYH